MQKDKPQNSPEIATNLERRRVFLHYINIGWLVFGVVSLISIPFFPELRRQVTYLVAVIFPTFLIVHFLNRYGRIRLAGLVFTITVNFGFYGLFLVLAHDLGAEEAFQTESTVWFLMGLGVLFAGTLVDKWVAPVLALVDTILIIGTRFTLAPQAALRPSAIVFWCMMAIIIWLYESTLHEATARLWKELDERKQAEAEIVQSEARSSLIFKTSPIPITLSRLSDGVYLDVNDNFLRISGFTRDEVIGHTTLDLGVYPDPAMRSILLQNYHERGRLEGYYQPFRSKSGQVLDTLLWVEPMKVDQEDCLLVLALDVTERRRSEEMLRESEAHYRTLFEHLPIPVFTKNREGIYTSCNAENLRYWAVSPVGYKDADLLNPEIAERLREADLQVMETGETLTVEEILKDTPLGKRNVLSRKVPLRDGRGTIIGILGASLDITERKQAEVEVRRRADEFAVLYEIAGDLAGHHDLPMLLQTIVERAIELLHAGGGGIYLYDAAQGDLEMAFAVRAQIPTGTRLPVGEGLAGRVALARKPMIIDDYQTWEFRSLRYNSIPFRSVVQAPMLYGGELIGILVAHELGDSKRKFTQVDAELLSLFAEFAASAVQAARLLQGTTRHAQETAALLTTSLALNSLDLDTTLQTISIHARALFAADGCRIFLLEPDGETLRCALVVSESVESFSDLRIKLGDGVTGRVAATGLAEIVNEMQNDPRAVQVPGTPEEQEAIMFAPIKEGERTIGVLSIRRVGTERPFQPADLELLKAFASMAASAVSNAHLTAETQRRLVELETLQDVSAALRRAHTPREMLSIIIQQSAQAVGGKAGSIFLLEESTGDWVSPGWVSAGGEWLPVSGVLRHYAGEGVTGRVGEKGEIHVAGDWRLDDMKLPLPGELEFMNELRSFISLPLHAEERIIGVLHIWHADTHTYVESEQRLLIAIANMAGNALHRARLFDETQRRLERLSALQHIEQVIASNLDLRLTMDILLGYIFQQLDVDATAVLLYHPELRSLEFVAGKGFRTQSLQFTKLRLGEGFAGQAALERRIIRISNLNQLHTGFLRSPEFHNEGFVAYIGVPLIAKGSISGVLEIYNRRPLETNPEWMSFLETLAGQAAIAIDNIRLFEDLQTTNLQLLQSYDATIEGWAHALELRDLETKGHSQRSVDLTLELARRMGIEENQLAHIRRGALLHDIGKMGVPDFILQKRGSLNEEEWAIMRQHPLYAREWLAPISYLQQALEIPYCHHEKWDGSGYPRGLIGEDIPLAARVFAIIDVWDALRSDRPYRAAWSDEEARGFILEQSGKHFDPRVVEAFLSMLDQSSPAPAA